MRTVNFAHVCAECRLGFDVEMELVRPHNGGNGYARDPFPATCPDCGVPLDEVALSDEVMQYHVPDL